MIEIERIGKKREIKEATGVTAAAEEEDRGMADGRERLPRNRSRVRETKNQRGNKG